MADTEAGFAAAGLAVVAVHAALLPPFQVLQKVSLSSEPGQCMTGRAFGHKK
jgi:hypothetical protein